LDRKDKIKNKEEGQKMDYKKYYYLEEYLFNEVKSAFYERGFLTAKEFFCIIIWKANRAKSKIAKRMKERNPDLDLQTIVRNLTKNLYKRKTSKERFVYLFDDWGFRLPMVSAILTVLFPNDFTVYDTRVCDILGKYHNISNKTKSDAVWNDYIKFIKSVKKKVKNEKILRDKDRWLWGKSFIEALEKDIKTEFNVALTSDKSG